MLSHSISSNPLTAWFGKGAAIDPKVEALYIKEYHFNDPIYIQYFYYLNGVLHGNLGFSPTKGESVVAAISQTLPYTLQIIFFSLIFTVVIGIVSGLVAARYAGKIPDKISRALYIVGFASPPFFIALAVILFFTLVLPILPTSGGIDVSVTPPPNITYIPIIDSIISGDWPAFESLLAHAILPSLANALAVYGVLTRILRSSLLDVMKSNFVTAAEGAGHTGEENLLRPRVQEFARNGYHPDLASLYLHSGLHHFRGIRLCVPGNRGLCCRVSASDRLSFHSRHYPHVCLADHHSQSGCGCSLRYGGSKDKVQVKLR